MGRRSTGHVVETKRVCGRVYALRFRAYGKRQFVTLGYCLRQAFILQARGPAPAA